MVTLDNIGNKLTDIIDEYSLEVKKDVLEKLSSTADEILNYISTNCPKTDYGVNHLADSFIKTEVGDGINKVIYISSKSKGRLVHLIELGFKHRSGVQVPARPFMRPAYDTFAPAMLEEIKRIISGGMS